MSPLEAIIQLLVLPPEDANSTRAWLRLVALNVQGFATQPEVVRRYTNSSGMRAEVRRWSEGVYLPLTVKKATKAEGALFLGQDGRVFSRKLDGRRFLRNDPGDRIADEIYEYIQVDSITANHLAIAQKRAVMHLLPIGYANWDKLPSQQRISLVQFGGSWPNAQAALESVSGNEYQQTLQLFLSDTAHPTLREEVLKAGLDGRMRPSPDILSWLLAQPDWNLDPALVSMARNAAADAPEEAWLLIHHPNSQVRLRLIDVYTGEADWVEWLVCESDTKVRSRILSSIEQSYSITGLVDQLASEKNSARKEAIGWTLAHWRPAVEAPEDWQALNNALFMGIGKANRKELKESLAKHGHLSLRGRIFT